MAGCVQEFIMDAWRIPPSGPSIRWNGR